jgi:hypothetical protein
VSIDLVLDLLDVVDSIKNMSLSIGELRIDVRVNNVLPLSDLRGATHVQVPEVVRPVLSIGSELFKVIQLVGQVGNLSINVGKVAIGIVAKRANVVNV